MNKIVSLSVLQACTYCQEDISQGSVVLMAARAGNDTVWHPQCFRYESHIIP